MSATIDTTLFCNYFNNCPMIDMVGHCFPVKQYYLEDCVELTKFVPSMNNKKRKGGGAGGDDEDGIPGEEPEENMNKITDGNYSPQTKNVMAQLSEKEINLDLIETLLRYITDINIPGAVLIFLPGWNLIFLVMKHLQQHPVFGSSKFRILPLHSQIPREDQRKVFDPVPTHVIKVDFLN